MLSHWGHTMLFEPLGPRELTSAVDLLNHFKLLPHFEFFCKRPLPVSISDTHYLHNVVGDIEIRKGDGMQLDQLIQNTSSSRDTSSRIQSLDLDILKEAFQLKETAPIDLPAVRSYLLWTWSCFFCCFIMVHWIHRHVILVSKFQNQYGYLICFFIIDYECASLYLSPIGRKGDPNCCREI